MKTVEVTDLAAVSVLCVGLTIDVGDKNDSGLGALLGAVGSSETVGANMDVFMFVLLLPCDRARRVW